MSAPQGAPQLSASATPAAAGGVNPYAPFLTMLAMVTAAMTLVLIVVGSLVTSHTDVVDGAIVAVGDSIPTWPFGSTFNVEMLHRIVAALVGFLTLGLAIALAATEPRRWVRRLGYLALVAVVAQALLGGVRVVITSPDYFHYNSPERIGVAMIHATFGQLIFGLTAMVALVTTQGWLESPVSQKSPDTARTRRLGIMTCAMVAAQILLGAWTRHVRFLSDMRGIAVWIHIIMACAVAVHVVLLSVRISNKHNQLFIIRQTAGLAVFFVAMQIFLGLFAYLMTPVGMPEGASGTGAPPDSLADFIRSGHVATGAMILAMCLVVTARTFHLLSPGPAEAAQPTASATTPAGDAGGNLHREAHA